MKILREGKEIELTKEELFNAYMEQQNKFDVQDIEDNMGSYLDETEYEILKDNRVFIKEAADQLRNNLDEYNMDYNAALEDALCMMKPKYL